MYWGIAFLLELALFASPLWRLRKFATLPIILFVVYGTYSVVPIVKPEVAVILVVFTVIRVFNLLRVIMSRVKMHQLRETGGITTWSLFVYQILIILVYLLIPSNNVLWSILAVLQVLFAALAFIYVHSNIRKLGFEMPKEYLSDKELPTLTVAIPARNETTDLEQCLKTVLASDYPKLEILVLDDCSQKKASDIIKGLSHNGVRFLKGREIEENWLAKNQAYQDLFQEASGEYILFCGVDVRFSDTSFRAMINLMKSRNKEMLSVLPVRNSDASLTSNLLQPMRYWWELALPRRRMNKPAVLSTCWLIERKTLKQLGGFGSVRNSIAPERVFASKLIKDDSYSFVRSSAELTVETVKSLNAQRATAVRTRYPLLGQNLENTLLYSIFQLLIFAAPVIFIVATILGIYDFGIFPYIAVILLISAHYMVLRATNPVGILTAITSMPFAVFTDISINFISMYQYEFGVVEWKDRNICMPVLKTYPKLPELKE